MEIKLFLKKYSYFFPQLKIPSVYRFGLNKILFKQFKDLTPGIVLDFGPENSYKEKVKHIKFIKLYTKDNGELKRFKENYFDVIIATHVLEHLPDPQKTITEIYRILKKGGICIVSVPLIEHYHPNPKDYYRFTWDSLNYLFKEFKKVEIYHHGNKIQSIWQILNIGVIKLMLNFFNPLIALINFKKTRVPCGFVVYVQK